MRVFFVFFDCSLALNDHSSAFSPSLLLNLLLLSVLQLSARENEVFYDAVAIVDPLTRQAQKISSLLIVSCVLIIFLLLIPHEGRLYERWGRERQARRTVEDAKILLC